MKNLIYTIAFLAISISSFAQSWEKEVLNSQELLYDAYQLQKEESYEEALEKINLVQEGDTNYVGALLEKANLYLKLEKYDECIKTCEEGLALDSNYVGLHAALGSAYDFNGDIDKSIEIYDAAKARFPKNYLFPYNKAITYQRAEKYDLAVTNYYDALKLNPYHGGTHIRLAVLSKEEGKLTQATLSLLTYLLINPESDGGNEMLGLLSLYLTEKPSFSPKGIKFNEKGDDFSEIDELIISQAALSKKYKANTDLDYNVLKQAHAALTLLKDYEPNGGFYDEFYVPFYQELMEDNQFEGFSYFVSTSSSSENVKKVIEKNIKELKVFADWYTSTGVKHFRNDENGTYRTFYSGRYNLSGAGEVKNEEATGKWTYYHEEGTVLSEGSFKNNNKTGLWEWFHVDGSKNFEFTFKDDIKDGPYKKYHKNGNLSEEGNYKEGELNGEIKLYFINGGIQNIFIYKDGLLEGKQYAYYKNGTKELEIDFVEGKQNGMYKGYYENGQLSYEYEVKDNLKNGKYNSSHPDGSVKFKATYKDDLLEGEYEKYFINGQLDYKSQASKGITIGTYLEYYNNGKLYSEIEYDESGKKNGVAKEYNLEGKLYYETTYVKGEQKSYIYYDRDGNEILNQKIKSNQNLQLYFPSGELKAEGQINKEGSNGKWTYFYKGGALESEGNYVNGERDGEFTWYYPNKQISSVSNYKDGKEDAYYKAYYINGELKVEGRIAEGYKVGPWKYYNDFGILTSKEFLVQDELNGIDYAYDNLGHIYLKSYYDLGKLQKSEYLDTLGNVYYTVDYTKMKEVEQVKLPNKFDNNAYDLKNYKNGILEGEFLSIFPNGVERLNVRYLDGERDGEWLWKYVHGGDDYKITYAMGKAQGTATNWDVYGFLTSKTEFLNDERNGISFNYLPNGEIYSKKAYMENELNGITEYYGSNKETLLSVFYYNSVPVYYVTNLSSATPDTVVVKDGKANMIGKYANGTAGIEMNFKNDILNGDFKLYNEAGKIVKHTEYENDEFNGTRIINDPKTGNKLINETFKNGYLHGTSYLYNAKGSVIMKIEYLNGNYHGDFIKYDDNGKVIFKAKYYDDEVVSVDKI